MRSNDRSLPQYLEDLVDRLTGAPTGSILHVEIRHDDDCPVFRHRPCGCEPIIESGKRIDRKYGGEK
jgi:hypothetical protein